MDGVLVLSVCLPSGGWGTDTKCVFPILLVPSVYFPSGGWGVVPSVFFSILWGAGTKCLFPIL